MKFYASGADLAKDMGVELSVLEQTHEAHYQAAKKTEKDPDGGSYPAYPSGKSWDEASGKTGSGKKFYHNIIPGSAVKSEPFYVAIITPVIHYCMGGLEIDTDSAVVSASTGKAIRGLYAAGEVAGGVHGNNRLGGNSLLDCVVFGRVAGKACTKYMLGDNMKETSLAELSGGGLSGAVESSKLSGGSYEDNMNKTTVKAAAAAPAAAVAASAPSAGGFTKEEVAKHTTKNDCWVILHDRVLDVTSFLSQHPGGELAILTFAGKDATSEFDMIHPPDVIEKYAPDAVIGQVGAGAPAAGGPAAAVVPNLPPGMSAYTKEEVAKHTTKSDCWVILNDKVLNVTSSCVWPPPPWCTQTCPEAGWARQRPPDPLQREHRAHLTDDCIRSVLLDHVRRVDHVELRRRILASESQDGELTTGVLREEVRHIEHLVIQDDPAIGLRRVFGHPPDVIEKYAPDAVIGQVGAGAPAAGGPAAAVVPNLPPGMSSYTKEEVAKHTTKSDCWVILNDKVLNVTNFLSQHPGGELAILTFAGKDATAEFDMIHPPDVVGKYAPDAIIGVVGSPAALEAGAGAGAAPSSAPARSGARPGSVKAVNAVETKSSVAHSIGWHLQKMDGWTWWIFIMTAIFALCVFLTPR
eukprot:CAMPEP_0175799738 /NCGR_PEP_ID=MMETSP0097-20121207/86661_1 /TAXON_ID=311494 /ORGANISM="Alexandrium monilatum, Strain CCMP3105" /LENGTH=634 /DNA_ID=CAMNT_0017111015 /DNA_START=1 /DNA_END=1905 /DNA_ORIENTATION=+